ncbi:MAG: putative toxin-antitoxin system toxin component, PIN family [Syntrophales bacterium]|nr:putative toxin-antitoxin system toxin component, PIN family [Syntrophales bacterium]
MIKVVLDTNVVVSAYLVPAGKPAEILSLARKGKLHIFLSREIVDEIERTLLSPKLKKIHRNTPEQISLFIGAFSKVATVTPGKKLVDFIKDDPDDNKILACALEGGVDYIVSGDHHLTDLKSFQGISIVNPHMFLQVISGQFP